tara:strand:+ start:1252 stop:1482 length:231 start_codon:yes stop_codon:yes gene_type:complete
MKDIKSFCIGFLTCMCLILIMGQSPVSKKNKKIGRYQAFVGIQSENLIDTATGEIWYYRNFGNDKKWVPHISPLEN